MEKLFLCQKFDTLFWNFIDMGEVQIMDEELNGTTKSGDEIF